MTIHVIKVWYQNDWGQYARRDEHLARRLLDDPRIGRVLHIEPPLSLDRLDAMTARGNEILSRHRERIHGCEDGGVDLLTPGIQSDVEDQGEIRRQVAIQIASHCEKLGILEDAYILWISAPGPLSEIALDLLGPGAHRVVVELEDDHRCYHPPGSEERALIHRRYENLLASSDIAFSVSSSLSREFSSVQPNFLHVPNSVDKNSYSVIHPRPSCLDGCVGKVVSYVGNLSLRLDWPILESLAKDLGTRGHTLALFGPPGTKVVEMSQTSPSVRLMGVLPANEVPAVLQHSDVLIMPHEMGEMTAGMDPQKLHEYVASGTPVVSTKVEGSERYASAISLASTPSEFLRGVLEALDEKDPSASLRRQELALSRTWDVVATEMLDHILDVRDAGSRFAREKKRRYYRMNRPEVRAQVPHSAKKILDVGCGEGALGAALKAEREAEVWGIECESEPAAIAETRLDRVLVGDGLACLGTLQDQSFDAIILADVLEHTADPEAWLEEIRRVLAPEGSLVMSVPNVRHWSVLRELLEGDFRYRDAGILDRTHLRFYTKKSLVRLLKRHGFDIDSLEGHAWDGERIPEALESTLSRIGLDVSSLGEESGIHQFIVVAHDGMAPARSPRNTSAESTMSQPLNVNGDPVTLVVPVVNTLDVTRQFLESLRVHTEEGSFQLIIVDNGSNDGTREYLATQKDVKVLTEPTNRGFAYAVNRGVREATTSRVCILNNDVLVTENWLTTLVAHLDRDPKVAFVAPSTNYANGSQQVVIGDYTSIGAMEEQAREFVERFRGRAEDVDFVVGLCMLGRKATFEALGPFDESFGIGNFEDNDYCHRARREGFRILIARDVFIHHHGSKSFQALGVDYKAQMTRNREIMDAKWADDPIVAGHRAAKQGDVVGAMRLFTDALRKFPNCKDTFLHVASCQILSGDHQGALTSIDRYLEAHPRSREALLMKAHALVALKRLAEALVLLEDLERTFYLTHNSAIELKITKASFLGLSNKNREACRIYEELLDVDPENVALFEAYVESAAKTGDPRELVGAIQRVAVAHPTDPIIQLELAEACRKAGDLDRARTAWMKALAIDPSCQEAKTALENCPSTPLAKTFSAE